ncbi:MAG: putative toxin-antitoxin system toxin component, PIN family [Nanoarchaeota archaeon]|nr:putative toxin-antitoxin system toxin component, PIN family [Nanoarchaeota archaeon]
MDKRVVLDTNILISAFGWGGNPKQIFNEIIKGNLNLIISSKQFEELSKVLDYPKFDFSEEQKTRFKSLILEISIFVYPKEKVNIIKEDPSDNIFLETAITGKVDFIITGNNHLLKLKEFKGVKIVTPKEFLEI